MDQAVDDPLRVERMRQERRLYHDFLKLNYRIFERYAQIKEVFTPSNVFVAKNQADVAREQERLDEVNAVLTHLSNMILSLEKNSESLLFSD